MTSVYITRTGARYHANQDCPSFADAEQEHGRQVERWPVDLRGLDLTACSVCWPRTTGYDSWRQFELEVERQGDSDYEVELVRLVLRQVPGLRPSAVSTQRKTYGKSGNVYFLDFVMEPDGGHRVAVEVDGENKAPGIKSPDEVRRAVESRRADLIAAGWTILNFSNHRVVTASDECVTELRAALSDAVPARPRTAPIVGAAGDTSPPSSLPQPVPTTDFSAPAQQTGRRRVWYLAAGAVLALVVLTVVIGATLSAGNGEHGVDPVDGACPEAAQIKGNISAEGERIYHEPGWRYYESTEPETCFETAADAEAGGYRASKVQD